MSLRFENQPLNAEQLRDLERSRESPWGKSQPPILWQLLATVKAKDAALKPPRYESVIDTSDYEKAQQALAAGYILLSVGTDPYGRHHYCFGIQAEPDGVEAPEIREARNAGYYRGRDAQKKLERRKNERLEEELIGRISHWRERARGAEGQLPVLRDSAKKLEERYREVYARPKDDFCRADLDYIFATLHPDSASAPSSQAEPERERVFTDGDHYVIATSAEGADSILKALHPNVPAPGPWKEVDRVPEIYFDDGVQFDGLWVRGHVAGSAKAFVSSNLRGLIGSLECCNPN